MSIVLNQQHDEPDEEDKRRSLKVKLPDLAVQKPRDSQIGVVAELSPGCSCFNYTFHTAISHIMLSEINIYML
jgi:hypothetical protein